MWEGVIFSFGHEILSGIIVLTAGGSRITSMFAGTKSSLNMHYFIIRWILLLEEMCLG